MIRKITFTVLLSILSLASRSGLTQTRSEVGGVITAGPAIELLSIAVEDFRMPSGFVTAEDSMLVWDLNRILRDDLAFSLYFNVVADQIQRF